MLADLQNNPSEGKHATPSGELRVLAVTAGERLGGPGKNLLDFAQRSAAFGIRMELATFRQAGASPTEMTAEFRSAGVIVHEMIQRSRFDQALFRQFESIVHESSPHLLQSHGYKSHALALRARRASSRPWIAFVHGWVRGGVRQTAYNVLERHLLRWADCVVAVSEQLSRDVPRKIGRRSRAVEVAANAISPIIRTEEARAEVRKELRIPLDAFTIGAIGRLSPEKRHDSLIRAVAAARETGADAYLIIAGEGPRMHHLSRLAKQLRVEPAIRLPGYRNDIGNLFSAFDAFALPSQREGSPNAMLEAMAAGLPIVASDIPGTRGCIDSDDACLFFPVGDSAALAEHIVALARSPALQIDLGRRSANFARRFDPDVRAARLSQIYWEAVKSERAATPVASA